MQQELDIINKLGLHARASAKLVQTASRFQADIQINKDGQQVNGKSIMGIMMLAAAKGSRICVQANGSDAPQALQAIAQLIQNRFGEDE